MSSVGEDRIYVMWVQSLLDCRVTDRIDVSSHFQTADSWIESTLLGAVIFRLQSRSNRLYVGAVIVTAESRSNRRYVGGVIVRLRHTDCLVKIEST